MRIHRQRRPTIIPGSSPGEFTGDPAAPEPVLDAILFGPEAIVEEPGVDPASLSSLRGRHPVVWLNVNGLGNAATIRAIGEEFGLHGLAMEDVMHTHQRTKLEHYGDNIYLVQWLMTLGKQLGFEQISIFLGPNFVLTFQERAGDCFDPVRRRLRAEDSRIRGRGADYLAYALIDALTDSYFALLDEYSERLETLEEEIIEHPDHRAAARIHDLRRDLQAMRRAVGPLRETLGSIARDETPLISEPTRPYLRDCHDHAIQVLEMVETCRERCSDLINLHQAGLANQMNAVMKVLTIIATIFIPLTFVAGVYGMNFDTAASPYNMPELGWYLGYPFAMALMLGLGIVMVLLFRRRGWL